MPINSSPPISPPDGYASWLDYAVETLDTRSVQLLTMFDDEKPQVGREAMRAAARQELFALKQAAGAREPTMTLPHPSKAPDGFTHG